MEKKRGWKESTKERKKETRANDVKKILKFNRIERVKRKKKGKKKRTIGIRTLNSSSLGSVTSRRSSGSFDQRQVTGEGRKWNERKERVKEACENEDEGTKESERRAIRDKFYRYFQYAHVHAKILYKNFNVNTLLLPRAARRSTRSIDLVVSRSIGL